MSAPQSCVKHLLTGLTVVLLVNLVGCEEPVTEAEVVRPVLAMKVGNISSIGTRSFPGRAEAVESANLAFEVAGSLKERPVNIGDEVKKGQLLARLDARDYRSKLKARKAELAKSLANINRGKELIKKGAISEAEFDRMQATYSVDVSRVETAQKALNDTALKAPFDGTISKLFVENFQTVLAKQEIARLVDITRIEMVIHIPEVLISLVPEVQQVFVRFDALPDVDIKGSIKEIGSEASETTRTYPVTVVMDQPEDITILPGMAGEVRADPEGIKNAHEFSSIQVPPATVFSPDASNESYVWVIDEKSSTVSRRAVTTGKLRSTGLTIDQGLAVGEWIAIAGVHRLQEGQEVELRSALGE
jgi:membrane fusion protein, multidrug efflux system